MNKYDSNILRLAVPSIVSNITVPLLGLVDIAIVGHMGGVGYIAAISVGTMAFNVMYWLLGFVRMSASGTTSQLLGARNLRGVVDSLACSMLVALSISLLLILFNVILFRGLMLLMSPTDEVTRLASIYFDICIWGAPASLGLFCLNGWFIGMQNSRIPMVVAITQNVVNILASLFFVYVLNMKVEGVALGTLIAQWCGFAVSFVSARRMISTRIKLFTLRSSLSTLHSPLFTLHSSLFTLHSQLLTLPAYVMFGECNALLYLRRLLAGCNTPCRQHNTYADVSSCKLRYGRVCQRC